ncbi:DUF433 domain-containing protein [Larkinella terrae]|uniref:DUF433 domain-containing protein n=1 Tax=Larkinella terrae TaxID=2025311 RepID=A0A7K0EX14_9BACT|nr:DUF433 domain-containing protein [Larkinella terrae]MRS65891.1 DUF433 domain-containing protein [Larkinella terrae]
MQDEQLLQRIETNPDILVGKPVIRGTRLSVQFILNLLGHGESIESILQEYDYINREDIQACLLFANRVLDDNIFMPLAKSA